jgi:RND family efflux transporter MFP subunit
MLWIAVPAMLLAGCDKPNKAKRAPTNDAVAVTVISVQPNNQPRIINAVGTIRYRREMPIGFTASGSVTSVQFDEGSYIKRGALLATLNSSSVVTEAAAPAGMSDAERARALAEFERIKQLYADGWVTKARFEAAEAAAKASSMVTSTPRARVTNKTAQLYSPSSGVVLMRTVEPGQMVSAGTPALILGQTDEGFVFRAPIIDADASKLSLGMSATINIEALGGVPITATISEIDNRANQSTGALSVQFNLPAMAKLKAGQIGTAAISLPASTDGGLQIPASALFGVRGGEALVYVVDPSTGRVATRTVIIDQLLDGFVIVRGALEPGNSLVVSGLDKLRTGVKVRPNAIKP